MELKLWISFFIELDLWISFYLGNWIYGFIFMEIILSIRHFDETGSMNLLLFVKRNWINFYGFMD